MADKIIVPLPNGDKLIAVGEASEYREIYVYVEDRDGNMVQDLVIVGNKYTYCEDDSFDVELVDDEFYVDVYANETVEDWTDSFSINRYRGED